MGKGDVKSKKGKITKGTFGNSRKHRSLKAKTVNKPAPKAAAPAGTAAAPAASAPATAPAAPATPTPPTGTSAPATAAPATGSAT